MLHQIQLPPYDQPLERIVQFQRDLLAFVCDPATPDQPEKEDFEHFFGAGKGEWFDERMQGRKKGSRNELYKDLCKLIAYLKKDPVKKTEILNAFGHDIDYLDYIDDDTFSFDFSMRLDEDTKETLGPVMIAFYERLFGIGFPRAIQMYDEIFDRRRCLKMFWNTNSNLKVCPACDGAKPDLADVRCDIDHFFPKSKYPFLSMHKTNLVPLCDQCNGKFKLAYDPIDQPNNAPLPNIFHPFARPAIKTLKIVIARPQRGELQIRLEEDGKGVTRRIENLDRVLKLTTRWPERLEGEIEHIRKDIKKSRKYFATSGLGPEDFIKRILKDHIEEQSVGTESYYLLRNRYADYALHNDEELIELEKVLNKGVTSAAEADVVK